VLANFDLAPDGRILALLPLGDEAEPASDHATLVLNFFDELERIHPRRRIVHTNGLMLATAALTPAGAPAAT
jgi:hypothetical protein